VLLHLVLFCVPGSFGFGGRHEGLERVALVGLAFIILGGSGAFQLRGNVRRAANLIPMFLLFKVVRFLSLTGKLLILLGLHNCQFPGLFIMLARYEFTCQSL